MNHKTAIAVLTLPIGVASLLSPSASAATFAGPAKLQISQSPLVVAERYDDRRYDNQQYRYDDRRYDNQQYRYDDRRYDNRRYDDRRSDDRREVFRREELRREQIRREQIRRDADRRVWIPGHYESGFLGLGRRWVEGHWENRR